MTLETYHWLIKGSGLFQHLVREGESLCGIKSTDWNKELDCPECPTCRKLALDRLPTLQNTK